MNEASELLLTPAQAAERSGLSEITIRDALRNGRLPGIHHAEFNRWQVRASDMDAYKDKTAGKRGRPRGAAVPKEKEKGPGE